MAYTLWNNSTIGFDQMVTYLAGAMNEQQPGLGASFVGLALIIPLFAIIFLVLGRMNPLAGFTTASFICWLAAIFLIALQLIHPLAFGALFAMWVAGAIMFYMQTRD